MLKPIYATMIDSGEYVHTENIELLQAACDVVNAYNHPKEKCTSITGCRIEKLEKGLLNAGCVNE